MSIYPLCRSLSLTSCVFFSITLWAVFIVILPRLALDNYKDAITSTWLFYESQRSKLHSSFFDGKYSACQAIFPSLKFQPLETSVEDILWTHFQADIYSQYEDETKLGHFSVF